MRKMTALLLTILFALSVMGCATTHDRGTQNRGQSYSDTLPPRNTSNP
jgi:hypothetical protein